MQRGKGACEIKLMTMLSWDITLLLVMALIATIFGFAGIGAEAVEHAKVLVFLFLGVLVVMLVVGMAG